MSAAHALQRVHGIGRLCVGRGGALHTLYQDGAAKIRLPRGGGDAVLINTAGGLTAGDRLHWQLDLQAGARLTATTPACEKAYRAPGGVADVRIAAQVAPGARLDWLPQETILFDGAGLQRRFDVALHGDAELLALEAVLLGRVASGEAVRAARFHDRWRIRRDGVLIFADDLRFAGDVAALARQAPILGGAGAFATVLLASGRAADLLEPARTLLNATSGASAFGGKLLCRLIAPDGMALRRMVLPLLALLRAGVPAPRSWHC